VSDLVQSVCREILNDFGDVELTDEDALRRWMFLTADRKLKDRARRYGAEKRGGGRPLVVHESWSHIDQAALDSYAQLVGPIDAAIAAETQARIESALQRLSEEDRRVILMTRIQRISHAEVAEALGRSPTYTRLLLYRALARLAKAMDAP
jgi:RNA polymerase sigma factor (sigma-70 family)